MSSLCCAKRQKFLSGAVLYQVFFQSPLICWIQKKHFRLLAFWPYSPTAQCHLAALAGNILLILPSIIFPAENNYNSSIFLTNLRMDGWTELLIEMLGRIQNGAMIQKKFSYNDFRAIIHCHNYEDQIPQKLVNLHVIGI